MVKLACRISGNETRVRGALASPELFGLAIYHYTRAKADTHLQGRAKADTHLLPRLDEPEAKDFSRALVAKDGCLQLVAVRICMPLTRRACRFAFQNAQNKSPGGLGRGLLGVE
jgi:hypothetical protein